MENKINEILFSAEDIALKVKELGEKINSHYKTEDIVAICILKGSFVFTSDLIRELKGNVYLDFMSASSYGNDTVSSGTVKIKKDIDVDVKGRNVLIIEDIIDTGLTLSYIIENIKERGAKSVKVCTFLDKKERRNIDIPIDFKGYEIEDKFIVGYGLDYAEKYRNLPYIAVLD